MTTSIAVPVKIGLVIPVRSVFGVKVENTSDAGLYLGANTRTAAVKVMTQTKLKNAPMQAKKAETWIGTEANSPTATRMAR